MPRYGMVIDLRRCVGCYACVMACKAENVTPANVFWNKVLVEEKGAYPNARLTFLPVLCNHCDNPPCETVCPTGATHRRPDGIVAVNQDKCMGCGYCVVACPYQQRTFNHKTAGYFPARGMTPLEEQGYKSHTRGTVTKCTLCVHRISQGQQPACSAACPARARIFGDLSDPDSEASRLLGRRPAYRLLAGLNTGPAVYYIPE
jgi:Fe-S-cluster-containing dehydrogenase component